MSERKRIIGGDIVQYRYIKGMSKHQAGRLGIVGYAPYSLDCCQVVWERRYTHEIVKKSLLTVVLAKKQAHIVKKLMVIS